VVTAAPAGGLRERKKARTREAITTAAIDLFEKQGYDETTVEEIAAAADVSPRTFFRYFDSKVDVIFSHDEDREDIYAAFAARPAHESVIEAVHQVLKQKIAHEFADGDDDLMLRLHQVAFRTPSLRAMSREHMQEEQGDIAAAFAQRLGTAPDALEPRLLATTIGGTMSTVFETWAAHANPTRETLLALIDEAFAVLERGAG
jgi:AcrR family transcriptional regulator